PAAASGDRWRASSLLLPLALIGTLRASHARYAPSLDRSRRDICLAGHPGGTSRPGGGDGARAALHLIQGFPRGREIAPLSLRRAAAAGLDPRGAGHRYWQSDRRRHRQDAGGGKVRPRTAEPGTHRGHSFTRLPLQTAALDEAAARPFALSFGYH